MKHQNILRSTTQVLCSILVIFIVSSQVRSVSAANGIAKTITFQGKVTNSNGTNVTDGAYDFIIKIYDGAGNGATTLFTESWTASALWSSTMSSAPSSGGSSLTYSSDTNESTLKVGQILWNTTKQESVVITSVNTSTNTIGISPTRQAWNTSDTVTNKIYVKDGIFKVAINSLNQDLSGVNFNTDSIFMGVEFNSDGEMKPRIQYTATPYAFNAEKVNGLTVVNTSDAPFSSTTTLKIGDGKTVQIDNGLRFSGTDGTQITFPNANDTVVVLDLAQTLTNKTIGSTGLVFSGATTDITTGTNENFVLSPNGTGRIGLGTTNPLGWLDLRSPHGTIPAASVSAITSFATFLVDQAGSGDIFAASSSGLARFSISNGGLLRLANGESIDNSTDNTIVLASNATAGGGVLRVPVKTTTGDPTLNTGGNIYYNQADGVFRCYQGGWVNCIASSNLQSTQESSVDTLSNTESEILSLAITPKTTTSQVWIVGTVEVNGDGNTNRTVTARIKRGASCAAGVQVGVDMRFQTDYANDNGVITLNFVDTPGVATSTTYRMCAVTDAGSPTASNKALTLYEPMGGAEAAGVGTLTVRESDSSPSVANVTNLEFGPGTSSTDEFIVTNQGGGVARVSIGNQVGLLNQNETVSGAWSFMGNSVGIGTTTPNAKLELFSNLGTSPIASFSGTTASAGLIVDNSGNGDLFSASSSGLNRFVIQNNGNVGIGMTPTWGNLQVHGVGTSSSIRLTNDSTGNGPIDGAILSLSSTGTLFLSTYESASLSLGTNATARLNIDSSGNVGIGTAAQKATLHVLGLFGTGATASVSARSSFAGLVVDNTVGDLFTASSSGLARFTIQQNGNALASNGSVSSPGYSFIGETDSGLYRINNGNIGIAVKGTESMKFWNNGWVSLNTSSPNSTFSVTGNRGTLGVANIIGNTSFAALAVDNTVGDLFTASASGAPRFTIANNGNITASGTISGLTGLTLASGSITLSGSTGSGQCLLGGATASWGSCGGVTGTNYWQVAPLGGAISPFVDSLDVLVGSTATSSALIRLAGTSGQNSYINTGGNVGIGTTAPTQGTLVVSAAVANTTKLYLAAANQTSGSSLSLNGATSPNGASGFLGKYIDVGITRTLVGGTTITDSGNFVSLNRNNIVNLASTYRISGDMLQIISNCTVSNNGVCTDSSSLLSLNQQYSSASGTLANLTNSGLGIGLNLNSDSGGQAAMIVNKSWTSGDIFTASSSGTSQFVIKNNGNVGIGTTNPANQLQINSSSTLAYLQLTNSTTGSTLADGGGISMSGNNLNIINSESGIFNFNGPASVRMTIDSSGNLGLGTTSPTAMFQVLGTTSTTPTASISARSSFAGLAVDNTVGDLLTASSSGLTRFVVKQNGSMGLGLSNPTAAKFVLSDSSQAPGVDMMQIAATTGTTTNGVDGLQVDFANTGSSANTNAGLTINVTSNNTNSSSNLYGINIGNLSSGGENANEVALNIGTGWDKGIVIATGNNDGTGLVYTGSGRPTKVITLSPEYEGSIITASGSATTNGSMTSDASPSANFRTYYQWTSSQTSLQDYTIAIRVTLPKDFSAWPSSSTALQIGFNTALTTNNSNKLDVTIYNPTNSTSTPVVYRQAQVSGADKTWTTVDVADTDLTDSPAWNTAGQTAVIFLKLYARDNNYVQIGDIVLNYLAAF